MSVFGFFGGRRGFGRGRFFDDGWGYGYGYFGYDGYGFFDDCW